MTEKISYAVVDMHDLSEEKQQETAVWVAEYIADIGHETYKMMKQTPEQILGKVGMVAFILNDDHSLGEKAGYMGATVPSEGPNSMMSEIGSLFVQEQYQGNGIAKSLMRAVVNNLIESDVTPYIFCNDNSLPIAEKVGFELAHSSDVPVCAIEACSGCVLMEKGLIAAGQCCDTIMIYKEARGDD